MRKKTSAILCAVFILSALLSGFFAAEAFGAPNLRELDREPAMMQETKPGVEIKLSEGVEARDEVKPAQRAPSVPLSDEEAENVLKRLQPLKSDAEDRKEFNLRDSTPPPPRTGAVVAEPFPPSGERREAHKPEPDRPEPLEILRYAPTGDVSKPRNLSVTFSQPMVALSSQTEAVVKNPPVKLTPQPPGRWRWLDTATLVFEPEGRFPMATAYTVEVPAGTKSAVGGVLAVKKTWSFKTPPPRIEQSRPGEGPVSTDPLMLVVFDQKIDPAEATKSVRVSVGKKTWKVRPATDEEIEADVATSSVIRNAEKERGLAFRISDRGDPLPADSTILVTVEKGTPSAEGPLKTAAPQSFHFKTYGPLRVLDQYCGWRSDCVTLKFNNPLDEESFDASQVQVDPEIPGVKAGVSYLYLHIEGVKNARTEYRIVLKSGLRDRFGQTLGKDVTLKCAPAPDASPVRLFSPDYGFTALDPYAEPRFSVFSVNHKKLKVRLFSVGPEHYKAFGDMDRWKGGDPPGRLVFSETVEIKDRPEELVETRIDLSPALRQGFGQVVVCVDPEEPRGTVRRVERVRTWVQVTAIGLDAFEDGPEALAWATSLKDGKPIEGVAVSLSGRDQTVETGADGLAKLPSTVDSEWPLVARKGHDTALLPWDAYAWAPPGLSRALAARKKIDGALNRKVDTLSCSELYGDKTKDTLRWFVYDDRGIYRPGEEARVKGWIRVLGCRKGSDVGLVGDAVKTLTYTLTDYNDTELLKGTCPVNALGGFDIALKLPANMNLGYAVLELRAEGASGAYAEAEYSHEFQVEEFRRPEFEVSASAGQGPFFAGSVADVTAKASYYAGGALPNADVSWHVTLSPAEYTPPGRDDFTFGKWVPWWRRQWISDAGKSYSFSGKTDGSGKHTLRLDFIPTDTPIPTTVKAETSVVDVNRHEWSASTTILVHPSDLCVGLKSARTFVRKGEPLVVQAVVTDLDGKAVPDREIRLRAVRHVFEFEKGKWSAKEKDPREVAVRSASDPVEIRFDTKEGGAYSVTASIEDDSKRVNKSELNLWVAGGKSPPNRDATLEEITIIPDRKDYQPGDTAELLIQAPFAPAEGLLTLRRGGVVHVERFRIEEPSHILRVSILDAHIPNVYAQVDIVGASARTDDAGNFDKRLPARPAFASGSINLRVPPLSRELKVRATPKSPVVGPGGKTTVDIEVNDASGNPVADGEVALTVVDEAVLGLTKYKIADPLEAFHPERASGTIDKRLRDIVTLADPRSFLEGADTADSRAREFMDKYSPNVIEAMADSMESGFMKKMKKNGGDDAAIRLRSDFNPLAGFEPTLRTDSNGRVQVEVKLPDNLTRYRVTAVAVSGAKRFGKGESSLTARLPVMVRPSAPRFLNYGDRFELPAVVQNQTDAAVTVDVAARASNLELTEGRGRRVTVPPNDRVEVRFPAAASLPGTARIQLAAAADGASDAAEIELPVWTPATTEAFAVYGQLDKGMTAQPIRTPPDVVKQFGGLEIETSSTQLQALTDALIYLSSYPFECSEQLASRILGVVALKDVLSAFKAEGLPSPDELTAAVDRDIKRLESRQKPDGAFPLWRYFDEADPYVSVHVAHALQRAKDKGFNVSGDTLRESEGYLKNIEKHISSRYSPEARRMIVAYSLYVRKLMGSRDAAKARKLIAETGLDKMSVESIAMLLNVFTGDPGSSREIEALRGQVGNRAVETAGAAQFATDYGECGYLLFHSARRADAIALEALIADQPQNPLIPKLVRGLLAHRKRGRWLNTQENVFALLALGKYFSTYEKETPDFEVKAWLGRMFAGEQEFRGRSTERRQIKVPMSVLADSPDPRDFLLEKTGAGRLYYRLGLRYAPANLKPAPAEFGFKVERVYEAVDDPADVRRDPDGSWRVRAGARVRVRLTMTVPARRYHVALVDWLPAGFEALNPALAVTAAQPDDPKKDEGGFFWYRPMRWFDHQNMRDERVEAFTSLLWPGTHTYSYTARATTPGDFIAPPPKAEEMYYPETFGRGAGERVVVK